MGGYLRRLGILKIPLSVPVAFLMPRIYQPVQRFVEKLCLEKEGVDVLTSSKACFLLCRAGTKCVWCAGWYYAKLKKFGVR